MSVRLTARSAGPPERRSNGTRLGTVAGIEVRVNWSVLLVALVLAVSLAEVLLPEAAPDRPPAQYWVAAVVATLLFFAGLLAHEFGHSLVARRCGLGVTSITLWLFGGLAELDRSPSDPRQAMRIAAAGPVVSIGLGVTATLAATFVGGVPGATLAWLGVVNLALAAFNLLPAFPMDGGRLYQAWRWARTGDELAATLRAAELGLAVGAGLVAFGLVVTLMGGGLGGLWLAFIGWFLREAARAESHHAAVQRPLAGYTVADVMSSQPVVVPAGTTVSDFVAAMVYSGRHSAYPVVDSAGQPIGLIARRDVGRLRHEAWGATTVEQVATPLGDVLTIEPQAALTELVDRFGANDAGRALVVADRELVGIVSPSDVMRLLAVVELEHRDDGQRNASGR